MGGTASRCETNRVCAPPLSLYSCRPVPFKERRVFNGNGDKSEKSSLLFLVFFALFTVSKHTEAPTLPPLLLLFKQSYYYSYLDKGTHLFLLNGKRFSSRQDHQMRS